MPTGKKVILHFAIQEKVCPLGKELYLGLVRDLEICKIFAYLMCPTVHALQCILFYNLA